MSVFCQAGRSPPAPAPLYTAIASIRARHTQSRVHPTSREESKQKSTHQRAAHNHASVSHVLRWCRPLARARTPRGEQKDYHMYVAQSERKEYGASWHTCTSADAEDESSSSSHARKERRERREGAGTRGKFGGGKNERGVGARDERGRVGGRDERGFGGEGTRGGGGTMGTSGGVDVAVAPSSTPRRWRSRTQHP